MSQSKSIAIWPAALVMIVAIVVVATSCVLAKPWPNLWVSIYAVWTLVCSIIAFVMFWRDKQLAKSDLQRIPERTLHTVAILGGWPGSVLGQQLIRHKSQKLSFRFALWAIVILHGAILTFLTYKSLTSS